MHLDTKYLSVYYFSIRFTTTLIVLILLYKVLKSTSDSVLTDFSTLLTTNLQGYFFESDERDKNPHDRIQYRSLLEAFPRFFSLTWNFTKCIDQSDI